MTNIEDTIRTYVGINFENILVQKFTANSYSISYNSIQLLVDICIWINIKDLIDENLFVNVDQYNHLQQYKDNL